MSKWPFLSFFLLFIQCTEEKENKIFWCDFYLRIIESDKVVKAEVTFIDKIPFHQVSFLEKPMKKINLPVGGTMFISTQSFLKSAPLYLTVDQYPPWKISSISIDKLIIPDSISTWEEFSIEVYPPLEDNEELWLIIEEDSKNNISLKYHGNPLKLKEKPSAFPSPGNWNIQPVRRKISALEEGNFLGQFTSEYYGVMHWLKFLYLQSNSTKQ